MPMSSLRPPSRGWRRSSTSGAWMTRSPSSWRAAADFGSFGSHQLAVDTTSEQIYCAVVFADVAQNPGVFLAGPDGFYDLANLGIFFDEEESIALGPVVVSAVTWVAYPGRLPDSPSGLKPETLLRRYLRLVLT